MSIRLNGLSKMKMGETDRRASEREKGKEIMK